MAGRKKSHLGADVILSMGQAAAGNDDPDHGELGVVGEAEVHVASVEGNTSFRS